MNTRTETLDPSGTRRRRARGQALRAAIDASLEEIADEEGSLDVLDEEEDDNR